MANQWWGYRHTSGSVQAKRFFGDRSSIADAYDSDFVATVVEPFEADSREDALRHVSESTKRASEGASPSRSSEGT